MKVSSRSLCGRSLRRNVRSLWDRSGMGLVMGGGAATLGYHISEAPSLRPRQFRNDQLAMHLDQQRCLKDLTRIRELGKTLSKKIKKLKAMSVTKTAALLKEYGSQLAVED